MSSTWYETLTSASFLVTSVVGISVAVLIVSQTGKSQSQLTGQTSSTKTEEKGKMAPLGAPIMSAPNTDLASPKDDPITSAQLAQHDGSDPSKPIYVAIKGKVFDVSPRAEMYGPGKGYHVFAGKDGSKGLGMSSLDPKDAVADFSTLNETQLNTLNQWESFFEKRYNVVGKVVAE
ncbi:hypothetical protein L204_104537 [Cryptococcus depauperatus]